MGKAKHRKRDKTDLKASSSVPDGPKLLKYAALGKTRKLRTALQAQPGLLAFADAHGATALHQACRHGQVDAVGLLLRRHADPSAVDAAGNTPGHLAAMHGHWLVLSELIQRAEQPPDLATPNHAGLSIKEIMQRHNSSNTAADAADAAGSGSDSEPPGMIGGGGSGAAAAAQGGGAGGAEAMWRARLAEEMSDDEGGWGGLGAAGVAWGQPADEHGKPAGSSPTAAAADMYHDDDADDVWADRLWKDMQDHRRRAAQAAAAARAGSTGSRGFSGAAGERGSAAAERLRRAAAAAAESARILREEQAKDSDWRAAMMRQVEEAALPTRRATYEGNWSALQSWPPGKPITFKDIPWPPQTTTGAGQLAIRSYASSHAAPGPQQQQLQELQLDKEQLRALVFGGATGPESVKLALRKELMRWHPDKFGARYGKLLAPADRESVLAGVQAVAQQLTALKQ